MISSTPELDFASSSTAIAGMTTDQQQRLTALLDQYLHGLEQGESVDVQQMIRENGDLADVLLAYLDKLDGLHGIAAGFQQHGELEPLVSGDSGAPVRSLQLGEYTIVREIGRGGMGIVYEAKQKSLDRRVALKLLPLASMLDSRQIARFKNESHAAAQLQHPHIVPVYSVGIERGIHFYAMQFIDGQTIESRIASSVDADSSTQWRESVAYAVDVANALHAAHECGIVHRDIKPANLMLDVHGKVWVTDFGLARCQNDLSLTLSGHLVGTMRYMSPEQACGRAELIDHRTDIYSLAATLYEMLTGRVAIQGDDGPSVLSEIASGNPPRLRRIMPQIPSDLEVVLQKAMSKEKDDRYATAGEFSEDLTAVLEDRPTLAKPPSIPVLAGRWASRHRKVVGIASLVFACGMIGLMASVVIISEKNRDVKASYDLVDTHFRRAQEAVDQLGNRVAAQLASVPGTEHIRQSLLRDTLAYYQDFVVQAAGDPQLRAQLALTHGRMGALVKELESAERSIPHYQRSAEIYDKLVHEMPRSPALVQAMAQNMNQLGLALFDAGRLSEAKIIFHRAIERQETLVEQNDAATHRTDLGLTKSNLGLLLREIGQHDLARVELTAAIEHLSAVVNKNGADVLATRGLAAALANLSSLSLDTDSRESIVLLEQAIDHQLRISRESPLRLKASSEIATTYNNLGAAYLNHNQPQEARAAFTNAVQIQRRLHSIAPLVDAYRYALAMSLNNLATALHMQKSYGRSKEAADEAIALQSDCLQHELLDASSLSRLGVMYNNLGSSLEGLDERERAVVAFQSAVEHQKSATVLNPDAQQFKQYLMQHYSNLLRLQIRGQHWRDAERTSAEYREAALQKPDQLVAVAEDMAELSKFVPAGAQRDRLVSSVAATIVSARKSGLELDSSLLLREPFRSIAHVPSLNKAVRP